MVLPGVMLNSVKFFSSIGTKLRPNLFKAFVCCTPMVLHCINSTDFDIHYLWDIFDRCLGVIFIRYAHRFRYNSSRGARTIVHRAALLHQFWNLLKHSHFLGDGHRGPVKSFQEWPITFYQQYACFSWLIREPILKVNFSLVLSTLN